MTNSYDIKSTLLYAVGIAIENEDDTTVKAQLEDLENKITENRVLFNSSTKTVRITSAYCVTCGREHPNGKHTWMN